MCTTSGAVERAFGADFAQRIAAKVKTSEAQHSGELVVVIEAALDPLVALSGVTGPQRAIEIFGQKRVWDTEQNNGVLLYVLLADRDIEILADRGIAQHVPNTEWQRVCEGVEEQFRQQQFILGIERAIEEVTLHLRKHFPPKATDVNELPDGSILV